MSKRKHDSQFFEPKGKRITGNPNEKKHTLDSDEEDFVDDTNILDENDIEGEEDGLARQDGEQRMTAFNMREELEEGHFDRDGHFIWNNEKEVRDNWLDNIDWQKIESSSDVRKYDVDETGLAAESDSEDDSENPFSEMDTYKQILGFMKPKESITKALKRLGGDDTKLSSVERLKRKKAGTLKVSEDVTKLTELANQILTRLGNMDVYEETYEQIENKIRSNESKSKKITKEPALDMYADDFDIKEKEKLKDEPLSSIQDDNSIDSQGASELKWEFKWSAEAKKIEGPVNTSQMIKWQKEKYFNSGVMVRKWGENSSFYSLSRIDFELYE